MNGVQRVFWSHSTCQSGDQLDMQDKEKSIVKGMSNSIFNMFSFPTMASHSIKRTYVCLGTKEQLKTCFKNNVSYFSCTLKSTFADLVSFCSHSPGRWAGKVLL